MSFQISTLKKQRLIKLNFILIVYFLLYFFSNNLIYAQPNEKFDNTYLMPIGNVLQIDAELKNIIVRNSIEGSPFSLGDAILKVNNIPVSNYGDFSNILSSKSSTDKISVLVKRGENNFIVNTNKENLEKVNFNNLLCGFATLTYVNPATGEFGAVGHPISIGSSKKIPIKSGHISTTKDLSIQKSFKGSVGSISAQRKDLIGKFNTNTEFGIKGNVIGFDTSNLKSYKVASLNEVKLGKAQILLQTTSYGCEQFDIEIIGIQHQRSPQSKTFKIKITDKNLLAQTGGIIQGMSGTPIVQDNKIIGAISHAVENDPTLGYAIFIQWMLEN
jgi:stage IV sporulation protein B